MQRVMDLPGWPPQSGGAFKPGEIFPQSSEEVTIERVLRMNDGHLLFACRFDGRSVFYDFPLLDEKTGAKVADILNDNIGKTLFSIGIVEIPED